MPRKRIPSVVDEPRRIDAEWLALNALREALGLGRRSTGGKDVSYVEALEFAQRVAPGLFGSQVSVLSRTHELPLVSEYRELAEAESIIQHRPITPLALIDRDIARLERLTGAREARQLESRLSKLRRVRTHFEERRFSEHKLIARDVLSAERPELPVPPRSYTDYVEYPLAFDQSLRIRMLHPDRPEYATGADLLYEFCDQRTRTVRISLVQYKIWNGRTLPMSAAANLESQLERLQGVACEAGLCSPDNAGATPPPFRLPHCAAFLRPTDRLQSPDASLISSGLHVPVCEALLHFANDRAIHKDRVRSTAVSQHVFEELFGRSMLGSRTMAYESVERIYREHHIFDKTDRIVVHAQEYGMRR